jgi:hypothetical protein
LYCTITANWNLFMVFTRLVNTFGISLGDISVLSIPIFNPTTLICAIWFGNHYIKQYDGGGGVKSYKFINSLSYSVASAASRSTNYRSVRVSINPPPAQKYVNSNRPL